MLAVPPLHSLDEPLVLSSLSSVISWLRKTLQKHEGWGEATFPQHADDAWVMSRAQVYNMNLKIRKPFQVL